MNKHSFTHSLVKGKDIHMATFINKLFPKTVDNQFLGNQFSLYIFYIITLITLWRSQHHMFSTDGGAQSIASIPLNHFSVDGATTVVGLCPLGVIAINYWFYLSCDSDTLQIPNPFYVPTYVF